MSMLLPPLQSTAPPNCRIPTFPESAAMITFANMDSDGLVILPVHHVIHGLGQF